MLQLVVIVFKALYDAQKAHRDHFLEDWECCCAGANDFVDMSDKLDDIADEVRTQCILSDADNEKLDNVAGALLNLYTTDSVYAAQKVSYFIFNDIYEAEDITPLFFSVEWLDDMPDNELAKDVVVTINDYMSDIEEYLDDLMIQKAIQALVTRFVNYYVELLLQKSPTHKSGQRSYFEDNKRALDRMNGDAELVREFFLEIAGEENRPLRDAIETEFEFFETIHEIMAVAAGFSGDDIRDYIYAFQTRIQKFELTYAVIGDLYHLVNPSEEKAVYEEMKKMEEELLEYEDKSPEDESKKHSTVPGLSLVDMLVKHVEDSKDKRTRAGESAMKSLFGGWGGGAS